jgi:hypothetical protein
MNKEKFDITLWGIINSMLKIVRKHTLDINGGRMRAEVIHRLREIANEVELEMLNSK